MAETKMCPVLALGFVTRKDYRSAPISSEPFYDIACVRERCQWWVVQKNKPCRLDEPSPGFCGFVPSCA